jgi:hypothetical protein
MWCITSLLYKTCHVRPAGQKLHQSIPTQLVKKPFGQDGGAVHDSGSTEGLGHNVPGGRSSTAARVGFLKAGTIPRTSRISRTRLLTPHTGLLHSSETRLTPLLKVSRGFDS